MSNSVSSVEGSDEKVPHFPDRSLRRLLQDPGYVRYLVGLLAPELLGHLDFDRGVQQNRSFIAEDLRQREADVLLRVGFRETIAHEVLHICILIEHQSRPEWLMRLRMLIYMIRIWEDEYRQLEARTEDQQPFSPILPILFYTGSDRWTAPMPLTEVFNVPEILQRFVPTFDVLFLDVKRTAEETLTESGHPFGWLLRVLQEEHADETAFRHALEVAASQIGRLAGREDTQLREALNYLILLIFHRRSEDERGAFIDIVKQQTQDETEVEIMAQTAADTLIEHGKEIGIAQSTREILIEGILENVEVRFKVRDLQPIRARLATIETSQELRELRRAALEVPSLEAFRQTLDSNPNS